MPLTIPRFPAHRRRVLALLVLLAAAAGCNEELGPLNADSGFSGMLRFRNWPPPDSMREMRVIVFDTVPRDSNAILQLLLAGKAAIWPAAGTDMPDHIDSLPYVFTTRTGTNLQVKNYEWVAVVYQYGPNLLHDWRPGAVWTGTPGSTEPAPLRILLHKVIPNIDMTVDFHNLPPIPWR